MISEAKWITDGRFAVRGPRQVFHRERGCTKTDPDLGYENSHILFRKKLCAEKKPEKAVLRISADDAYKLYVNGAFVYAGPAPAYHFSYGYDEIDVTELLNSGENCFAFHTYYQGLINRVWQSGDGRHGLICELEADGRVMISSDESFLTHAHTAYSAAGTAGYDTQFLEKYDSRAAEVGFERPDFDDSGWDRARVKENDDHCLKKCFRNRLMFERIEPQTVNTRGGVVIADLGGCFVGYVFASARGRRGETVRVRCGQELDAGGRVRSRMRCNCDYDEEWILSGGDDELMQFDYKSLRYVEFEAEEGAEVNGIYLLSRHRPFTLKASIREEYADDAEIAEIWNLCVRSQRYGVQENVQDCMDREKGVYLGDGCYTAFANAVLTKDDSLIRFLINDAFESRAISDTLMSCLNCSHMQEIAEYPLLLVQLILWHFRLTSDRAFLEENLPRARDLLEAYRSFERNGLLCDTLQWCVTEWPAGYRDNYAVTNDGNTPYASPHVVLCSYYLNAVSALNEARRRCGMPAYRNLKPLTEAFEAEFYDPASKCFYDSKGSRHISYIGNIFPYAYGLCSDPDFYSSMTERIKEKGITGTSLFASFPLLTGLLRRKENELIKNAIKDRGAWLRMIREGATSTFECWGADEKKNASLFHLLNTYVSVFISDTDLSVIPV